MPANMFSIGNYRELIAHNCDRSIDHTHTHMSIRCGEANVALCGFPGSIHEPLPTP